MKVVIGVMALLLLAAAVLFGFWYGMAHATHRVRSFAPTQTARPAGGTAATTVAEPA